MPNGTIYAAYSQSLSSNSSRRPSEQTDISSVDTASTGISSISSDNGKTSLSKQIATFAKKQFSRLDKVFTDISKNYASESLLKASAKNLSKGLKAMAAGVKGVFAYCTGLDRLENAKLAAAEELAKQPAPKGAPYPGLTPEQAEEAHARAAVLAAASAVANLPARADHNAPYPGLEPGQEENLPASVEAANREKAHAHAQRSLDSMYDRAVAKEKVADEQAAVAEHASNERWAVVDQSFKFVLAAAGFTALCMVPAVQNFGNRATTRIGSGLTSFGSFLAASAQNALNGAIQGLGRTGVGAERFPVSRAVR